MPIRRVAQAALAALAFSCSAIPAAAQQYEAVGIRAQGMGGAFVAVADDATASWWNPAGLASGAYLDSLIEYGVLQEPRDARTPADQIKPAVDSRARGIAFAFPAMGLSYYRIQISEIRPLTTTAGLAASRQEPGAAEARLRSVVLRQYGATVGQSVGNHLVIASTLKLVHGSLAASDVAHEDATFDHALDLEGDGETHSDLDIGAMARFGSIRLGVSMRNARAVVFGADADPVALSRRARAGLAVLKRPGGAIDQLTIAFDADLTKAATLLGETKNVAGGIEGWLFGRRVGVRAGLSKNTLGTRLLTPSGGVSLALRPGAYLEGQYTAGSDGKRRGWGFDTRVTF